MRALRIAILGVTLGLWAGCSATPIQLPDPSATGDAGSGGGADGRTWISDSSQAPDAGLTPADAAVPGDIAAGDAGTDAADGATGDGGDAGADAADGAADATDGAADDATDGAADDATDGAADDAEAADGSVADGEGMG